MRIYLLGYMASGKTNLGRLLATKLAYDFIDIDYLFEERYRISVLDFFEKYDESTFRNLERMLLLETIHVENTVISTGGGTPCFFENMQCIRQSGISIYLRWDLAELVARLRLVKRKRPLLKDIPPTELEARVETQLMEREIYYNQADLVVNGRDLDPDNLVAMIRERIIGR